MNKLIFIFILTGGILLTACKEDDEIYDAGFGYYPVSVGDYKIYQVQKISYEPVNGATEENFEIKEVVAESFVINNELRYRLERYKRGNSSSVWPASPDSVWTVAVSKSKVIRVENNIRYVKLVFPVENGRSWNGNMENVLGEETYLLKEVNKPYTVPAQEFANTATVLHIEDSSLVSKDYRKEVFAKDVGMIYRMKESYEYNQEELGSGIIDAGVKYYEKLSSYGKQ